MSKKAGTVILLGAVIIWYLSSYPPVQMGGTGQSYAERLGGALFEPYMRLMGLDWRAAVSLLFGIIAKENVISTFRVIYGSTAAMVSSITPPSRLTCWRSSRPSTCRA